MDASTRNGIECAKATGKPGYLTFMSLLLY